MKKTFMIEWRLDDISQHDIVLALNRHNPIWQVLEVTELPGENLKEITDKTKNIYGDETINKILKISLSEKKYPCDDCGKLRTKDEGGTTFTVCDECWDKHYKPDEKWCECGYGISEVYGGEPPNPLNCGRCHKPIKPPTKKEINK